MTTRGQVGASTPRRVALWLNVQAIVGRRVLQGVRQYLASGCNWVLVSGQGTMPIISPMEMPTFETLPADGILAEVIDAATAARFRGMRLPVVNVASRLLPGLLPSVTVDNDAIGRAAAQHLHERGHHRFAFVGIPDHRYSDERGQAFADELDRLGHRVSTSFGWPDHDAGTAPLTPEQDFRQLHDWLASLPRPIGIMACNDIRARHVVQLAMQLGLRVPEDVSVVGADNDELQCELADVPLSSVDVGLERVGYEAAALLDRLMRGEPEPAGPMRIPPAGVVTRRSSDVLAIDDPDVATAVAFIREHADRNIEVEDVLDVVHVSRRTLERRFAAVLGRSPREEIRRVHLDRARSLLSETDLPMPQVAQRAGFANAERLSAIFRRCVGQTPTAYRRQFRFR